MTLINKQTLHEICAPIQTDLDRFSVLLKTELASSDALIQEIHDHILKMTGKFLRPILTILSARLGERGASTEAVRLAVAVELIHTATLVHDDIIDDSDWRRNQPSVHSRWGRELSIVSGDYLYAKAFMLLAGFENPKVNQAFAACAHVMCEGEMKQIEKRKDFSLSEEEYLKIIHKKTAALFQASCAGGAYFGTESLRVAEAMGRYGYALGMAFQIVDDCLDLVGEAEAMGKKAGLDLSKRDMTLPLVYLIKSLSLEERTRLMDTFQTKSPAEVFSQVKNMAVHSGAVERSMEKARLFAEEAAAALKDAPEGVARESLSQLVDYCMDRAR